MKKIFLIFFLMILLKSSIFAHPHVFIQSRVGFGFDDVGLKMIKVTWVFDAMFSSLVISDYDKNKNNKFESSEVALIKEEAFSNLKDLEYLTFIKVNNKKFNFKTVNNFYAKINNKNLVYSFEIPCSVKKNNNVLSFAHYDKTMYIDITYVDNKPVEIIGNKKFKISHKIVDNMDKYFDNPDLFPEELVLKFNKKL